VLTRQVLKVRLDKTKVRLDKTEPGGSLGLQAISCNFNRDSILGRLQDDVNGIVENPFSVGLKTFLLEGDRFIYTLPHNH
jgi:hypothetical protein